MMAHYILKDCKVGPTVVVIYSAYFQLSFFGSPNIFCVSFTICPYRLVPVFWCMDKHLSYRVKKGSSSLSGNFVMPTPGSLSHGTLMMRGQEGSSSRYWSTFGTYRQGDQPADTTWIRPRASWSWPRGT